MPPRVIPEVGHVFYPVRIMDETTKTFRDLWQQVANGVEVGYVEKDLKRVDLPAKHSALPMDPTPHFLPGIVKDPDPKDTAKSREQAAKLTEAANVAAASASIADAAAQAKLPGSPPQ